MHQAKVNKSEVVLRSHKALEMIMRDVLDSMYDTACFQAYSPYSDCVQILSISPPSNPNSVPDKDIATVHPLPNRRSSNVLDYLMQRESRLSQPRLCQNC